jgi:hypothetical protein
MNILGYHPLFAFNVFLVYFISGKPMGSKGAIRMLYDFLFYKPSKNEYDMKYGKNLKQYIRKKQIDQVKNLIQKDFWTPKRKTEIAIEHNDYDEK